MVARAQGRKRVVADVGGTNTRMAVFDPASGEMSGFRAYLNRDYDALEAIIADWLGQLQQQQPADFCLAAAAPPAMERVTMVNLDWSFSCGELATLFGFDRVHWLNDFQANASLANLYAREKNYKKALEHARAALKLSGQKHKAGLQRMVADLEKRIK